MQHLEFCHPIKNKERTALVTVTDGSRWIIIERHSSRNVNFYHDSKSQFPS